MHLNCFQGNNLHGMTKPCVHDIKVTCTWHLRVGQSSRRIVKLTTTSVISGWVNKETLFFSSLFPQVSTINFQQLSLEFQQLNRGLTAGKGNKLAVRDGEGAASELRC